MKHCNKHNRDYTEGLPCLACVAGLPERPLTPQEMDTPESMKVPAIQIVERIDGAAYGLVDFSRVDEWGQKYDTTWSQLTRECRSRGFSEDDRIRLLAIALLRQKHGQL